MPAPVVVLLPVAVLALLAAANGFSVLCRDGVQCVLTVRVQADVSDALQSPYANGAVLATTVSVQSQSHICTSIAPSPELRRPGHAKPCRHAISLLTFGPLTSVQSDGTPAAAQAQWPTVAVVHLDGAPVEVFELAERLFDARVDGPQKQLQ